MKGTLGEAALRVELGTRIFRLLLENITTSRGLGEKRFDVGSEP